MFKQNLLANQSVTKMAMVVALFFSLGFSFIHGASSKYTPNYQNPLKGLSSFVFMAAFPAQDPTEASQINTKILHCLSSFGTATSCSLIAKEGDPAIIDFTGFSPGSFLSYEISPLEDIKGESLNLFKANLSLVTRVEISKTKQDCMPVVWSHSCFLKKNKQKTMEDLVWESLYNLLEDFQEAYMPVNADKPSFNFYP